MTWKTLLQQSLRLRRSLKRRLWPIWTISRLDDDLSWVGVAAAD